MSETKPLSVGDWMWTLFILAIPVVNIIMYLIWAFGNSGNLNRKNFCIASLLWGLILFGVALLAGLIVFLVGARIVSGPQYI